MVSRRSLLIASGGLGLVCAAGVWRVMRMPETAYDSWNLSGIEKGDIRLNAFAHAILAPNPHNRQPWLIRLESDNGATLLCDLDKRLPETDPFDRQTLIGFGTFIELARIAAAEAGYALKVSAFPEGEPDDRLDKRPIAHLAFVADETVEKDELYLQIPRRRSTKSVYDPARPVSSEHLRGIADVEGMWSNDAAVNTPLGGILANAVTIEMQTPRTHLESVRLMRIGSAEIDRNPDGIQLKGPLIEAAQLAGFVDRDQLADPTSEPFKQGLEDFQKMAASVPAAFWIATPDHSRTNQLEAGRRYVRANLRATALGLAMHPMSQALQEYPEMARAFGDVHRLLGVREGERIQMLARVGYSESVGPAPRWPLAKHIQQPGTEGD